MQKPLATETQGFSPDDARWSLVRAILDSRTFSKSARLSSFLQFIAIRTLEGRAKEINEQQIGIHVFGRSLSYNPTDDGIVRTQARLLRQRLEEYFEHESPNSELVLHIPKGGYVPVFEKHLQQELRSAAIEPLMPATSVSATSSSAALLTAQWPWAAAIAVLVLVTGYLVFTLLSAPQSPGASHVLWASIFAGKRPAVIVPSDDALVIFQELTKTPVSLDDYLSENYVGSMPTTLGSMPLTATWFSTHQYTSVADLNLAVQLARIPEARNRPVETRYARDMRMDDLKTKNVVLIGGIGANPWVGLFENQLNFNVNYDWKASEGYVTNKSPKAGEERSYRDNRTDGQRQNFGVVAFLPGLDGNGEALLFQGTGMAGTESAADFLFNTKSFDEFAREIGATREKVPHFEVLLETTRIGGKAPQAKVITYRLLTP